MQSLLLTLCGEMQGKEKLLRFFVKNTKQVYACEPGQEQMLDIVYT